MRSVPEWIGKTPRRKPIGEPITVNYFFERSIPEPNSGCWIWLRAHSEINGYGVVRTEKRTTRAHRLAYQVAFGVIVPRYLDVCHHCDVRCCVNPDHLFVGTRTDNMRDCANKGRIKVPRLEGDNSPNSKLNSCQVLAIRADARSQRAIARHYGVDKGTIAAIRKRSTWRSV